MAEAPGSRLEKLFAAAVELEGPARQALLERECGADAELRRELEELLAADADTPPWLDIPAIELHRAAFRDEAFADEVLADEALADEAVVLLGQHAGPWRLEELVGRGGMALVFRAVRIEGQIEQRAAVKVIRGALLPSAGVVARFRAEQRTLASLEHPDIVALLDAGSLSDGRPFFVMEHVDAQPIDHYCAAHGLSIEARLELMIRVCRAVHHAHQRLVVHRDLKPSNLLVTADGAPKLLDFGVAKLLDADAGATRPGIRAPLTPAWASPEQIRGEPVTTASDIYALGVLLYRLLAGSSPYGEVMGSASAIERAVLESRPPAPSAVGLPRDRRRLRGDLDTIVLTALAKDPERRYSSAEQFADDLRRHLDGLPVRARGESLGYRAGKFLRRHRVEVGAAAAVVLSLAWATVASRLALERARASESIAWQAHADAVYVTNYLASVLEEAGAGRLDSETAVLEVLAEAEARIERELGGSPEAEARLRYAVGRVYARLERWSDAETHARRALELSRQTLGLGWQDVVRNLELLARVLEALGDPAAMELRRESAELRRVIEKRSRDAAAQRAGAAG